MSKVIFILRRYCPGEAWTNRTLAYAKGLAECGADVRIYYLISDKKRSIYSIDIPNVQIFDLWKDNIGLCKFNRYLSYIVNLLRVIKYINPGDSIFLYGGDYIQLKILNTFCKKAYIYTEITEHPDIVNRSGVGNRILIYRNRILKDIQGIFVISQSLRNYFISQGIPENKIYIINMFVDADRFKNLIKSTEQKYIAYCGAVSYEKDGVDLLIRAFSIFYQSHPDYILKIFGNGVAPDVLPRLKKLASLLNVGNSVVFSGKIEPERIPQLLCDASIMVLARPNNLQAQNGFPTKLGEYLATGNPVVVTRVGDIPLFIRDKENGFLATPDDPEDFAQKLSWIANNYDTALQIGKEGQKLVMNEFSYKTQSYKVFNILKV